ncbi:tetratricopeptide repeat protein [Flavobacteriaceae bacterium TP-CH-4]|uniref:histidine kinase n=1 Tax=Pelagihabitans pacificus TaxID=2696054 RepID=A0A967E5Z8_9FLAO|nr:sensor histidine kinase [Pelagihabitans pacificus]NHF59972.1 tetratricopeptide repeat protein [Pelagihabitans pacificus]
MKYRYPTWICLFVTALAFSQVSDDRLATLKQTADSLYDSQASYHLSLQVFLELDSLLRDDPSSDLALYTKSRIAKNYNAIDNTDKAIAYSKDNLLRSEQAANAYYQTDALLNLVVSYTLKREFDTAMDYYEQSQQLMRRHYSDSLNMDAKNALAFLNIVNGDTDQAIVNYQKALELATKLKAHRLKNKIAANLSYCYMNKEQYDQAIAIGKRALAESSINNFSPKYIIPSNIGSSYQLLKQYDSALYYFEMSHRLASDSGVKLHIATADYDIGSFYFDQGMPEKAIPYFMQSYALSDSIESYPAIARASRSLSHAYEQQGDYRNSLRFLKKHQIIEDTLAERSKQKKLEEFQTKYATKEKEEQILILDKENAQKAAIIQQKEYQRTLLWTIFTSIVLLLGFGMWGWHRMNKKKLLSKQENLRYKSIIETEQKERKRIAQDLHDSLGQTISAIRMQAASLTLPEDQEPAHGKLIKQVDHAYDELRNISHNIMPDTLIKLGLVPAIRELVTELTVDNMLKIELQAEEPVQHLSEDESVNLFRIVQEILSNTIKHAQATLVNVILENNNKHFALRISDNGKGMDPNTIDVSKGLGWKNIVSRATLISAKMDVKSQPDHGTTISILL